MQIVLYSTGCPKCKVLKGKLAERGIAYSECNDVDTMLSMGIKEVPVLRVEDSLLSFSQAVAWINSLSEER